MHSPVYQYRLIVWSNVRMHVPREHSECINDYLHPLSISTSFAHSRGPIELRIFYRRGKSWIPLNLPFPSPTSTSTNLSRLIIAIIIVLPELRTVR